jgi:hypothetical protein
MTPGLPPTSTTSLHELLTTVEAAVEETRVLIETGRAQVAAMRDEYSDDATVEEHVKSSEGILTMFETMTACIQACVAVITTQKKEIDYLHATTRES